MKLNQTKKERIKFGWYQRLGIKKKVLHFILCIFRGTKFVKHYPSLSFAFFNFCITNYVQYFAKLPKNFIQSFNDIFATYFFIQIIDIQCCVFWHLIPAIDLLRSIFDFNKFYLPLLMCVPYFCLKKKHTVFLRHHEWRQWHHSGHQSRNCW